MNQWNLQGVPHKGWVLENVIDVREDGREEGETDYESCMMCGNEKIRYVHILAHPEVVEKFRAGCVCAEKMTGDYINPKQREKELKNKTNRRINWAKRQWKLNLKGNYYLIVEEHYVLIYRDSNTKKFKVKIADTFGHKVFDTLDEAKMAVFNGIEYLKQKGDW